MTAAFADGKEMEEFHHRGDGKVLPRRGRAVAAAAPERSGRRRGGRVPFILATNDDGYDSEGLLRLKQALQEVGEVVVVAPDRNWSAAGHTKTINKPLWVWRRPLADGDVAMVTDGTPSDCVALAVLGLARRRPDLVVSGINQGWNLGDDITYSGTVAAAMEGAINGIPSVAISLVAEDNWRFEGAALFAARLARHVLTNGLGGQVLLNVNVPSLPPAEIKGVAITRLGRIEYRDQLIKRRDPRGGIYYWIGGERPKGVPEPGTDVAAVFEHKISVTPIRLDLTNERLISEIECWNLGAELPCQPK